MDAAALRGSGRRCERAGVSAEKSGSGADDCNAKSSDRRNRFCGCHWMEQQGALFRALRLEKLVTAIFIGLITLVAGLNILVVLSMTVTDRAKDIAVLRFDGFRSRQLRIFSSGRELRSALPERWQVCVGIFFRVDCRKIPAHPARSQVYAVAYVPFHPSVMDGVWIW